MYHFRKTAIIFRASLTQGDYEAKNRFAISFTSAEKSLTQNASVKKKPTLDLPSTDRCAKVLVFFFAEFDFIRTVAGEFSPISRNHTIYKFKKLKKIFQ